MGRWEDLRNKKFGNLTVIAPINKINSAGYKLWRCKCDCGTEIVVSSTDLKRKRTTNCGCKNDKNKSDVRTLLYYRWKDMRKRCYNQNNKSYPNYGARGIQICDEWREDFQTFYMWCMKHGFKPELEIDRIDNDGNYSPQNCRFVTRSENQRNKSTSRFVTIAGETKTVSEWAQKTGIPQYKIFEYLKNGKSVTDLLGGN